jgi:hypothetical protein
MGLLQSLMQQLAHIITLVTRTLFFPHRLQQPLAG